MEKLFNKTQELREFCKEIGYDIAFRDYECECGKGISVFDSKRKEHLFNISNGDTRTIIQLAQDVGIGIKKIDENNIKESNMTLEDLRRSRNAINRKISLLKKESLNN